VIKSYRDLQIWQEAVDLVELVYRASAAFPADERFGLTSQLRRSSVSIPSNIAEGHARPTTRDYLRFLGISLGSLAEMETQILIASDTSTMRRSTGYAKPAIASAACSAQ